MGGFQGKYVRVNGIDLYYRELGDPEAPDILLVHGWSTTGLVWADVARALSDSYHVVVTDNRGNGNSEVPSDGHMLSDYAEDIHQLIQALGLRRPYFVGHSWGANIGTHMAAEYPRDLSKVLLEDPVYWKMVDAFVTIIPMVLERRSLPEAEVRREALEQGLSPEQAEREVYLSRHFSPDHIAKVAEANRGWALECEHFLKRITVPTLILVGDSQAGGYITREALDHYRRIASPSVRFRLWDGVGHLMHATQPERFVQELRAFLTE